MLRENSDLITGIHKAADLCTVALSFVAAYYLKRNFFSGLQTEPNYYLVLLIIILISILFFRATGCYLPYRNQTSIQVGMRVVRSVVGILVGTIVVLYLLHEGNVSRLLLLLAPYADGVVMAVKTGYMNRIMIGKAIEQLRDAKANLLGLVLNQVDTKREGYYHYYTSGYYGEQSR